MAILIGLALLAGMDFYNSSSGGQRVLAQGDPVLVGAGDIGTCGMPGPELTARHNAYPDGSASDYKNCYDPTWGRHKARTRPALGGHDDHSPGAKAAFDYSGENPGPASLGY